jgi:hypothetical protein
MKGTCIRCGKPFRSVDDIHTCTPPRALVLADELERHLGEFETATRAAAELRRLHAENDKLRESLRWHILVYRVGDEAWDQSAEVDRIMALEMKGEK